MELDVSRADTSKRVEEEIRNSGGVIDVVVNNAGYSLLGSIEDMSEEEIQMQFATNVFGPVRVLKGVLPFMRARRSGVVVNVGSIAGIDGLPSCAMYAGSKFALEGMVVLDSCLGISKHKHDHGHGNPLTIIRHVGKPR